MCFNRLRRGCKRGAPTIPAIVTHDAGKSLAIRVMLTHTSGGSPSDRKSEWLRGGGRRGAEGRKGAEEDWGGWSDEFSTATRTKKDLTVSDSL